MQNQPDEEFLRPDEIAKMLKVGQATPYKWIREGALPCYRLGKSIRVAMRDLENFLQERRTIGGRK